MPHAWPVTDRTFTSTSPEASVVSMWRYSAWTCKSDSLFHGGETLARIGTRIANMTKNETQGLKAIMSTKLIGENNDEKLHAKQTD